MAKRKKKSSDDDRDRRIRTPDYEGTDRRSYPSVCYNHGAHEERMASHSARIKAIEESKPVTFHNFRWIIGLGASVMLALFVIPVYMYGESSKDLTDIKIKQETTIYRIEQLALSVEEMKNMHRAEINQLHRKMNDTINEVLEGIRHPHP